MIARCLISGEELVMCYTFIFHIHSLTHSLLQSTIPYCYAVTDCVLDDLLTIRKQQMKGNWQDALLVCMFSGHTNQ